MRYIFEQKENSEGSAPMVQPETEENSENKIKTPFLVSLKQRYCQWPSFCQWKKIFKLLKRWEKITLLVSFLLFLTSGIFLLNRLYIGATHEVAASGGKYIEGSLGQPRLINPLYSSTNDADRDIAELVFSGLVKYDSDGKIIPDLAESYEIKDNGKTYEFRLKDNVFWHDGEKFTADDVSFTIKAIQNSDYKSPLRANWLGVDIEEVSPQLIKLKIKTPYTSFLENCAVKIMPKHVWEKMPAENFPLAIYNLQPIGTGPYKFKSLEKDKMGNITSFVLSANARYFNGKPYISEIIFEYFNDETAALNSLKSGKIDGLSFFVAKGLDKIKKKPLNVYDIAMPRYFAIFLNGTKNKIFQDKNIRDAINYGIDKQELISKILLGHGTAVQSPIMPSIFGFAEPEKTYGFDIQTASKLLDKTGYIDANNDGLREKVIKKASSFSFRSDLQLNSKGSEVTELQKCLAIQVPDVFSADRATGTFGKETETAVNAFQMKYASDILTPAGFKEGTGMVGKSTRTKLNEVCPKPQDEVATLEFSLTTINQPEMVDVANFIKDSLAKNLGIKVNIQLYDKPEIEKDVIKPRNYEALLFGEVLNLTPDLYSFWHSSQKKDPGLNLALYENKNADKLLEEIRQTTDQTAAAQKYVDLQKIITNDDPAIFLYAPDFLYPVSKDVKGINIKTIIDPSKRFSNINNWYMETKRSF